MCSTTSSTDFQIQDSGHVLEWDVHRSGDLFIFAGIYRKQQKSFIRMVGFMPLHHVRYISRLQRHYISSVPVKVVPKEHAYYLTSAMALFGSTRGGSSGSWSILQDDTFLGHLHNNAGSYRHPLCPGKRHSQADVGFLDGSEIPLQSKPKYDHETYFSRKKIYGLISSDRPVHVYIHTRQATLRAVECEVITTNADATVYTSNGGGGGFCGGGGGGGDGGQIWRVVNCQLELSIPFCCLSFFGKCKLCSQ